MCEELGVVGHHLLDFEVAAVLLYMAVHSVGVIGVVFEYRQLKSFQLCTFIPALEVFEDQIVGFVVEGEEPNLSVKVIAFLKYLYAFLEK